MHRKRAVWAIHLDKLTGKGEGVISKSNLEKCRSKNIALRRRKLNRLVTVSTLLEKIVQRLETTKCLKQILEKN